MYVTLMWCSRDCLTTSTRLIRYSFTNFKLAILSDFDIPIFNTRVNWNVTHKTVSRQLVYGHFVYDTSSTDISSTDISSTVTFLVEIEAGVMKQILYQQKLD